MDVYILWGSAIAGRRPGESFPNKRTQIKHHWASTKADFCSIMIEKLQINDHSLTESENRPSTVFENDKRQTANV